MNMEYYTNLSKKEDKLIIIAVDKDVVAHSEVDKDVFETMKDVQNIVCKGLMDSLNSVKKA